MRKGRRGIRLGGEYLSATRLVYSYYGGTGNPTSCTSKPTQGTTGNNGNVGGYFYQDSVNSSLGHTAAFTYDTLNRLTSDVATGNSTYNLTYG